MPFLINYTIPESGILKVLRSVSFISESQHTVEREHVPIKIILKPIIY